jgi:Transposase DDE domain
VRERPILAEISVSDDHLIVAQRVTQNTTDNDSLEPMVDQVKQRCGAPPGAALADSGFFSINNLKAMEQRNIDAYLPDSDRARALNLGVQCPAGPVLEPIAACGPSCEVRSSKSSNNNALCANFAPVN